MSKRSRTILIALVTFALFTGITGTALAWSHLGNLNPGTQWYSPYSGEKWGQIVYSGGARYLDVEAWNLNYGDRYAQWLMLVFHAFRSNTNCYIAMNATGYWWTNFPNPQGSMKSAKCGSESGSYNNEFRAQPGGNLDPHGIYYAGS